MNTAPAPKCEQLLRLRAHLVLVAGRRGFEEHRGLRQIGRHHPRARDQFAQPAEHIAAQQFFAGGRDDDRIEHDIARLVAVERGGDDVDGRGVGEHADLDRAGIKIGEHGIELRGDEIGRHIVNAEHALGVLRRQRGDDGRAIDAERGKGLQIGLDAGAAARIRAGNGEGNGALIAVTLRAWWRRASRPQTEKRLFAQAHWRAKQQISHLRIAALQSLPRFN